MSLDLDWWNALFKTTSVILAALTFIAGAGALLTERAVTARQSRQLAQMERDSAQQRERAANAERDAAAAKSGTLDALAQVAAANQRTETLAIQAAEQQERAANAERELLTLRERLKPRTLSAAQRAAFVAALSGKPAGRVQVLAPGDDHEATNYARAFAALLKEAGWDASVEVAATGFTGTGLEIQQRDRGDPLPHVLALHNAFKAAGLTFGLAIDPRLEPDTTQIVVAHKE